MNNVYFLTNFFLPYGFFTIIVSCFFALLYFLILEHIRIKKAKAEQVRREKPREEVIRRWRKIRKIRKQREKKEKLNKQKGG